MLRARQPVQVDVDRYIQEHCVDMRARRRALRRRQFSDELRGEAPLLEHLLRRGDAVTGASLRYVRELRDTGGAESVRSAAAAIKGKPRWNACTTPGPSEDPLRAALKQRLERLAMHHARPAVGAVQTPRAVATRHERLKR